MSARLPILGTVPTWHEEGLCQQVDPDLFFPEKGQSAAPAKQICWNCPVRTKCRTWALERGEQHGVWGGLSEKDRRELRRREAVAA